MQARAAAPASFPLAACAEMLYRDLPMVDRVRKLHALGFMVELWDWTRHDLDALRETGAVFSSITGSVSGRLGDADGAAELLQSAKRSIAAAQHLGAPRLNLHGTALGPDGLPLQPCSEPTGAMWTTARDTLRRLADLGAEHDVTFVLENLNAVVDHPGVPFGRAADCLALVRAVDHPNLGLMLDLYHAQIGEGNLTSLLQEALPFIGEIQVADVPGRCEPGTGEINYPHLARALQRLGYTGPIGLEAFASGDEILALARFRAAFTLPDTQ